MYSYLNKLVLIIEPKAKLDSAEYEKLNYFGPGLLNFRSSCFLHNGKHINNYLYFYNFAVFIFKIISRLRSSQLLS